MKRFKRWIKSRPMGLYLTERYKKVRYEKQLKTTTDRAFIERIYQKRFGVAPNVDHPETFGEKLQWLKLYYRDPLMVRCADKAELKTVLREQGLEELAIPTLGIYDNMREISKDALPENVVIKATHGSGWQFLCNGDKRTSWRWMTRVMDVWLSESLYIYGREWNYKDIPPRVMVEPLLADVPPVDYKFFCFHGTVRAVQTNRVIDGRLHVDFYDPTWNRMDGANTAGYPGAAEPLEKPTRLSEMRWIAERLSVPFPFVRVDMYCIDERLYVGEMTFFPSSGLHPIKPLKWERTFGAWLTLPKKNVEE